MSGGCMRLNGTEATLLATMRARIVADFDRGPGSTPVKMPCFPDVTEPTLTQPEGESCSIASAVTSEWGVRPQNVTAPSAWANATNGNANAFNESFGLSVASPPGRAARSRTDRRWGRRSRKDHRGG